MEYVEWDEALVNRATKNEWGRARWGEYFKGLSKEVLGIKGKTSASGEGRMTIKVARWGKEIGGYTGRGEEEMRREWNTGLPSAPRRIYQPIYLTCPSQSPTFALYLSKTWGEVVETILKNPGIWRVIWEAFYNLNHLMQHIKYCGRTFMWKKLWLCIPKFWGYRRVALMKDESQMELAHCFYQELGSLLFTLWSSAFLGTIGVCGSLFATLCSLWHMNGPANS